MHSAIKAFIPATAPFELYSTRIAFAATVVAVALLIVLLVRSPRGCQQPTPIPEYAIRHTWWGRVKNMLWRILAAVAGFLIMRWLILDGHADAAIERAKAAIAKVIEVLKALIDILRTVL